MMKNTVPEKSEQLCCLFTDHIACFVTYCLTSNRREAGSCLHLLKRYLEFVLDEFELSELQKTECHKKF